MATKNQIGKARRESMGISVDDMAELIGCSNTTIYKYESGKEISGPYVTAYWTILERQKNGLTSEMVKIAELKSRVSTLRESDRSDIKIMNLTNIIKTASEMIYEISEKDKRVRINSSQTSLSNLTKSRR